MEDLSWGGTALQLCFELRGYQAAKTLRRCRCTDDARVKGAPSERAPVSDRRSVPPQRMFPVWPSE